MPYKFLEHVTHADTAFEATGKTMKELFEAASMAVIESMANPKTIKDAKQVSFEVDGKDVDRLLFNFMEEIVLIKDRDGMVFNSIDIELDEENLKAKGTLHGDEIKPDEQELHQDVKAVTMHYYKVEHDKDWKARVVLDI